VGEWERRVGEAVHGPGLNVTPHLPHTPPAAYLPGRRLRLTAQELDMQLTVPAGGGSRARRDSRRGGSKERREVRPTLTREPTLAVEPSSSLRAARDCAEWAKRTWMETATLLR
jgi:hypothetical protein